MPLLIEEYSDEPFNQCPRKPPSPAPAAYPHTKTPVSFKASKRIGTISPLGSV
jgi:hypothetical protein